MRIDVHRRMEGVNMTYLLENLMYIGPCIIVIVEE